MDIKPTIRLDELPKTIVLPNPGGRELVITPEESGVSKEQVFTSEDLPHEIPYELLGLVKFPDGNIYPKYRANVTTIKEQELCGARGVINGISIINKIAWWLTHQEDRMIIAQSIKYSDLKSFDYKNEKLKYWLAFPVLYASATDFPPGVVVNGHVDYGGIMFLGYAVRMAVRPTMVLKSKVQLVPLEIPWMEF